MFTTENVRDRVGNDADVAKVALLDPVSADAVELDARVAVVVYLVYYWI